LIVDATLVITKRWLAGIFGPLYNLRVTTTTIPTCLCCRQLRAHKRKVCFSTFDLQSIDSYSLPNRRTDIIF